MSDLLSRKDVDLLVLLSAEGDGAMPPRLRTRALRLRAEGYVRLVGRRFRCTPAGVVLVNVYRSLGWLPEGVSAPTPPELVHSWPLAFTVKLTNEHRRAVGARLGRRSLASADDFAALAVVLLEAWVVEAVRDLRTKQAVRVRRAEGAKGKR